LAAQGHHVEVFTHCNKPGVVDDVTWRDLSDPATGQIVPTPTAEE